MSDFLTSFPQANIRTPAIRIELDRWSWEAAIPKRLPTLDLTAGVKSYTFQKSIAGMGGSAQISAMPQFAIDGLRRETHILDLIQPMDVIRIYEFNILKFLGMVTRVSYSGSIKQDGKPERSASIFVSQFADILGTASVGIGLGAALGTDTSPLYAAVDNLRVAISDAMDGGLSYGEILTVLYNQFRRVIEGVQAAPFLTYMDEYIDVESGLSTVEDSILPRTFELFTGTEQTISYWQVAEQLAEKPLNEMWIDNGPRSVWMDSAYRSLPAKSNVVFRATPFDAPVFQAMPSVGIPSDLLLRFDFARSMDQVYTLYSVHAPELRMDELILRLSGQVAIDEARFSRYLLRPFNSELFFISSVRNNGELEASRTAFETASLTQANRIKGWFENNDEFLSGTVQFMVPENSHDDPRIGDKVSLAGVEGHFYAEGVSHQWTYQGALISTLTVTRGYDHARGRKQQLTDRVFLRNRIR